MSSRLPPDPKTFRRPQGVAPTPWSGRHAALSRRTLLRGVLGGALVTLGLPPLELFMNSHGTAYAGDTSDGFPRRFGLFFWGNGVVPTRWVPAKTGTDYELSEELLPLAAHKSRLAVVTGMRVTLPNTEPHFSTGAGFLTGRPVAKIGSNVTVEGPTIDQIIAAVTGQETRFPSLEAGCNSDGLSYTGPNAQNPVERSPLALFERVFGGSFTLPGDTPKVDPTLRLKRSVLDAVSEQLSALKTRVGANDQLRLQQHFEGVRALEKRLARLEEDPPQLAACALPQRPATEFPDVEGRPPLAAKNAAVSEILALALACDQTRVISSWFTHPVSNVLVPGAPQGHHELTHNEPGDQPEVHKITVQCIEAMAQLCDALAGIQEGTGTLLDHMVVLGTSDVGLGKTHSPDDFPILLVGSAGGALKTGHHYRSGSNETTSKVLLSVARGVGLDLASFGGADAETQDGLSAIEA